MDEKSKLIYAQDVVEILEFEGASEMALSEARTIRDMLRDEVERIARTGDPLAEMFVRCEACGGAGCHWCRNTGEMFRQDAALWRDIHNVIDDIPIED